MKMWRKESPEKPICLCHLLNKTSYVLFLIFFICSSGVSICHFLNSAGFASTIFLISYFQMYPTFLYAIGPTMELYMACFVQFPFKSVKINIKININFHFFHYCIISSTCVLHISYVF